MSTQTDRTEIDADDPDLHAAIARARYVRVTPQKARRVVDLVRGKSVAEAVATLRFAPQAASEPVLKLVSSAVANARHLADQTGQPFDERALVITSAYVDEGPTMKRFRPRAQGRASRVLKRTSHITITVAPGATTAHRSTNARGGAR